jgi:hypothetical protein
MCLALPHNPVSSTNRTRTLHRLSLPRTSRALHLYLLKYAWRDVVTLYPDTVATALLARLHNPIFRSRPLARRTNSLFLYCEFALNSVVEIPKGELDSGLFVRAPSYTLSMSKVSAPSEEATEQIEGIVVTSAASASLLMLLQTLMAVLVVDAAGFGRGEGVVGFCYLDEFVMGGLVAGVFVRVVLF